MRRSRVKIFLWIHPFCDGDALRVDYSVVMPSQSTGITLWNGSHGTTPSSKWLDWEKVRWPIAGLLFVAALLKAIQLGAYAIETPTRDAMVIAWEGVLAIWLLVNINRRLAWGLTLLTFALFAAYNGWGLITGQADCGCLGIITLPTWVLFVVDLSIVLMALRYPPRPIESTPHTKSRRAIIAVSLILIVLAGTITLRVIHGPAVSAINGSETGITQQIDPPESQQAEPLGTAITFAPLPTKLSHDLGYMRPGTSVESILKLTNTTEHDITIRSGRSTCDCLKIENPKRVIPSGEQASFKIVLDAPGEVGRYQKQIYLRTDAPTTETVQINVTADIGLPLKIDPSRLIIESPPDTETVRITNCGDQPIQLLYSTANQPGLFAKMPRKSVAPNSTVEVEIVTQNPEDIPPTDGTITLHTTSQQQPTLRIPVTISNESKPTKYLITN